MTNITSKTTGLKIEFNTNYKLKGESTFDRVVLTGKVKKNSENEKIYQMKSYTKVLDEKDICFTWWKRAQTLENEIY